MAEMLKLKKGLLKNLGSANFDAGSLYITTDEVGLYIDTVHQLEDGTQEEVRARIGDLVVLNSLEEWEALPKYSYSESVLYYITNGNMLLKYVKDGISDGENDLKYWVQINSVSDSDSIAQTVVGLEQAVGNINAVLEDVTKDASEAKVTANTANQTANEEKNKAIEAEGKASTAETKAIEAATAAGNAVTEANEAKELAGTANTAAEQAKTDAAQAKSDAAQAKSDAETAGNKADSAYNLADAASTTATNASATASEAAGLAGIAKTKAENAESLSNTAKTKAENAESLANTAKTAAEKAEETANAAQTAAGNAAADASEAKTNAAKAKEDAAEALQIANDLDDSIKSANTNANEAKTIAGEAKELATAANTAAVNAEQSAENAAESAESAAESAAEAANLATTANNTATTANNTANTAKQTAERAEGVANAASTTASNALTLAQQNESDIKDLFDADDEIKELIKDVNSMTFKGVVSADENNHLLNLPVISDTSVKAGDTYVVSGPVGYYYEQGHTGSAPAVSGDLKKDAYAGDLIIATSAWEGNDPDTENLDNSIRWYRIESGYSANSIPTLTAHGDELLLNQPYAEDNNGLSGRIGFKTIDVKNGKQEFGVQVTANNNEISFNIVWGEF